MSKSFKATLAAAFLLLTMTSCMGNSKMPETCEMKLEALTTQQAGPLELSVIASRQLCIVQGKPFDPRPYAARLQVTNKSTSPIEVTYPSGAIAQRAFTQTEVVETLAGQVPTRHKAKIRRPPVNPAKVREEKVSLAPGASHVIPGTPSHMLPIAKMAVNGVAYDGGDVSEPDQWLRRFELTYTSGFSANGARVQVPLTIPLEIVLTPKLEE